MSPFSLVDKVRYTHTPLSGPLLSCISPEGITKIRTKSNLSSSLRLFRLYGPSAKDSLKGGASVDTGKGTSPAIPPRPSQSAFGSIAGLPHPNFFPIISFSLFGQDGDLSAGRTSNDGIISAVVRE